MSGSIERHGHPMLEPRHAILVLGPPGGASALVTGALGLRSGVAMPFSAAALEAAGDGSTDDLCPPLARLHDALLSAAGSAWDDWGALDAEWLRSPASIGPKSELLAWLHRELGKGGPGVFLLDDPRACRLVAAWQDVLDAFQARLSVVLAVREPLEVAARLRAVRGLSAAAAHLLWLRSLLDAEAATRGLNRVVVLSSQLADDPSGTVARIASGLEIALPDQAAAEQRLGEQLLAPGLMRLRQAQGRRNLLERMALAQTAEMRDWGQLAYRAFAALAGARGSAEAQEALATLDRIRAEFQRASALFAPLVRTELAAARARQDESERAQARAAERLRLALDVRLAEREAAAAEREAALHQQVAKREAALHQQAAEREAELSERLAKVEAVRDEALFRLNTLHGSAAWQLGAPLRALDARLLRMTRSLAAVNRVVWSLLRLRLPAYLRQRRRARTVLESGLFDEAWYVPRNPDVVISGHMPLQHWLAHGWREGRDPGPRFDTRSYLKKHPELLGGEQDPLTHHLVGPDPRRRGGPGARTLGGLPHRVWRALPISMGAKVRIKRRTLKLLGRNDMTSSAMQRAPAPSGRASEPEPVPLTTQAPPAPEALPVRLVAFYLPQFHPIPENDAWWGRGFTEWRNVVRGRPRFEGHYQPHLPGELGFYDLRLPEVQDRQVELARLYGVGAFCFYFYWFGGKRLLERPIRQYLEHPELDLPFCLCWANENWSRRWDGRERDLLMAQTHSDDDDLAFIAHVADYMRDPRYLRIDGRPLLLVYRPVLLPSAKATAQRWRRWCREHGVGELFLAYAQSFEVADPAEYGFDAAIEFPPNYHLPPDITGQVQGLESGFTGSVFDWNGFVAVSRAYSRPDYTLFRTVNPGWDNEARRPGKGSVFHGSTPAGYAEWLENAARDTVARFDDPDMRLVFVNAWNEWAEGAHLEPDQRYGYAYLQATRDAMERAARDTAQILVVTHDTERNGAQLLALSLATTLSESFRFAVHVVSMGPGPLRPAFERVARFHDLSGSDPLGDRAKALARRLSAQGVRWALVNTVVSGPLAATLSDAGIAVVSLVHELPGLIRDRGLQAHARAVAAHAHRVVFAAEEVRDGFEQFAPLAAVQAVIRPQGLYQRNPLADARRRAAVRRELRESHGLPPESEIVLGVGFGDHRKGIDLFVAMGCAVIRERPAAHCMWVGEVDGSIENEVMTQVHESGLAAHFHFVGWQDDTGPYYAAADVYALTSREDPFPSVVLEALHAGMPVVAFDGGGGYVRLVDSGCVRLAPPQDAAAFAAEVTQLLEDDALRGRLAEQGPALVRRSYGFQRYVHDLVALMPVAARRVSVVIPNYNYQRYLPERLGSVAAQTWPAYETIVLDDASTDGSQVWLAQELAGVLPESDLLLSVQNSGSVFQQWLNGVERASGDYVWIAEADDAAEPEFLEAALGAFDDPRVVLSYTQSASIDADGKVLSADYLHYVADLGAEHWQTPYVADGLDEVARYLSVKNTIPNVSACVFRREPLLAVLRAHIDELKGYKVAGDWVTYFHLARRGAIAFTPRALNRHRRHGAGMTLSDDPLRHLEEILKVQQLIRHAVDLPEESKAAAVAYAERLYRQFELADAECPTVWDHPRLRRYLPDA